MQPQNSPPTLVPRLAVRRTGSANIRRYFRETATGTAGNMREINQQIVISAPCRVPAIKEQTEIVRRVDTLFDFADRLEARHRASDAGPRSGARQKAVDLNASLRYDRSSGHCLRACSSRSTRTQSAVRS